MSACERLKSNLPNLATVEAGAVTAAASTSISIAEAVTEVTVKGTRSATTTKIVVGATGTAAKVVTAAVPRHFGGSGLEFCRSICGVMGQRLAFMCFEACTETSRTAVRKMSKEVLGWSRC